MTQPSPRSISQKNRLLPAWLGQFTEHSDPVGALLGLTIVLISFSLLSAPFRRIDNLSLITMEASFIGIIAIGQTLVLMVGGIDLSVGSVVALSGVVAASLMKGLGPLPPLPSALAIMIGLMLGLLIGLIQGWLITRRGIPPFIVTLGTMIGLRGITQAYINSVADPIHALPDDFKWLSDSSFGPLPAPALLMVLIAGLTWHVLRNTRTGRYCYAIGSNETAARLAGVKVARYKTCVYAFNSLLAAVVGMILIARINGGSYTNGEGYELNSIAAACIGGTSLKGGIGGIGGTLIGVLLMATVNNGLTMNGVAPEWRNVVTGIIIILAVWIDAERRRVPVPSAPVDAEQHGTAKLHLQSVLAQLANSIETQLGCRFCRVYLLDRDSDQLIQQVSFQAGRSTGLEEAASQHHESLVWEVKKTGLACQAINLTREEQQCVVPLDPSVQSALALPFVVNNRIVGVLEVQSIIPDGFNATAQSLLARVCMQWAATLENAWLLESGWLARQLRDALRHIWDDLYLGNSALAIWALSPSDIRAADTPGARGEALRALLQRGIEMFRPAPARDQSRINRNQRILQLTYVEQYAIEAVLSELGISRRQYFYDLKEAIELLADALVRERRLRS